MALSSSEVSFVLSGGSSNSSSADSLGGEISAHPVSVSLFGDVTKTQSETGYTSYRCIYVTNDSSVDTLYSASIYIDAPVTGGADAFIGTVFRNDRQQITLSGISGLTGGSFTLLYESTPVVVNYNSTPNTVAANMQTALRAISGLSDLTVFVSVSVDSLIFEVNFIGEAGNRYHPLIVLSANDLTPVGSTITSSKIVDGAPMNGTADEIDVETTIPVGVTFNNVTSASPLLIGDLQPLDTFYVWMKRSVSAGTEAIEDDGFTLRLTGNPLA